MHYRYLTLEQRGNLEQLVRSRYFSGGPLEAAINRLHKGDYGVCGCGRDIEYVRLVSNPWTRRCHACARSGWESLSSELQ